MGQTKEKERRKCEGMKENENAVSGKRILWKSREAKAGGESQACCVEIVEEMGI